MEKYCRKLAVSEHEKIERKITDAHWSARTLSHTAEASTYALHRNSREQRERTKGNRSLCEWQSWSK